MRTTLSLVALLAAAACSSGSTTSATDVAGEEAMGQVLSGAAELEALVAAAGGTNADDAAAFATAVTAFEAEATDLNFAEINNSRFDAIPAPSEDAAAPAGSADFSGFVNVNAGPTANLAAQIALEADFQSQRITGEQTSAFFGAGADGLEAYDGEIAITNGRVGAMGVANNARIDIAGTLTNGTNTVVVDADIIGKFLGTPVAGARGIVTDETQIVVPSDDADAPVTAPALSLQLNGEDVVGGSAGFLVTAD